MNVCQSRQHLDLNHFAPFAGEVLCDDCNKTLHTPQDGTMDDDWAARWSVRIDSLLSRTIFQVETLRQLEVELNRRALK